VTSLPETIGDPRFTFDPENTEEMAEKIFTVLTNDRISEEIKENSRRRVQDYSWEKAVSYFISSYAIAVEQFSKKKDFPYFNNWLLNYEFFLNEEMKRLQMRFIESEKDRAARLEVIHRLDAQLKESAADLATKLEIIVSSKKKINDLENTIGQITSSLSWRIVTYLHRIYRLIIR
jgi:hypothetical protein